MRILRACLLALVLAPALTTPQPASALPAPGASNGPTVNLRPRFTKGQELRYTLHMKAGTKMSGLDGADMTQEAEQDIGLALKVKDVSPETGATIDLVYESLKVRATQGGVTETFDSSKPRKADDPNEEKYRPLVGLSVEIKLDKDGNITSVSGGDALAGTPASALAENFSGADIVKGMLGKVISLRPSRPEAAVGDSWTDEDAIHADMGDMKITTTTTLRGVSGPVASLTMRGSVTMTPNPSLGVEVSIKDSNYTGDAQWNTETGSLVRMTAKQNIDVETKVADKVVKTRNEMTMEVTRARK